MQEIQGFFGMDAPVCAPMRRQRHLLLTGWSMVRIRPGEPNLSDITAFFASLTYLPTILPHDGMVSALSNSHWTSMPRHPMALLKAMSAWSATTRGSSSSKPNPLVSKSERAVARKAKHRIAAQAVKMKLYKPNKAA
jgi:hypothetical protein